MRHAKKTNNKTYNKKMKTIVVYYSNKGSNKYLAEKISKRLSGELEEIKPRLNIFLLFLMNIHLGIKPIKTNIKEYDKVVLCGPIWIGKFIPPLRSFIKKYYDSIHKLVFVTCCGSTYEKKDEKLSSLESKDRRIEQLENVIARLETNFNELKSRF